MSCGGCEHLGSAPMSSHDGLFGNNTSQCILDGYFISVSTLSEGCRSYKPSKSHIKKIEKYLNKTTVKIYNEIIKE